MISLVSLRVMYFRNLIINNKKTLFVDLVLFLFFIVTSSRSGKDKMNHVIKNMFSGFPTRSDTNRAVQPKMMANASCQVDWSSLPITLLMRYNRGPVYMPSFKIIGILGLEKGI